MKIKFVYFAALIIFLEAIGYLGNYISPVDAWANKHR